MARSLEADIKQVKPFKSLREETILTLVRTAADLELVAAKQLKPFGITPTQYNVLRILRGAGEQGLCRNEIGARLVRAVPDVTRLLDRMEESGLIVRERGDRDRRYVSTRLTRQGLELVDNLDIEIERIHEQQIGHLSTLQLTELRDLLQEVRKDG